MYVEKYISKYLVYLDPCGWWCVTTDTHPETSPVAYLLGVFAFVFVFEYAEVFLILEFTNYFSLLLCVTNDTHLKHILRRIPVGILCVVFEYTDFL